MKKRMIARSQRSESAALMAGAIAMALLTAVGCASHRMATVVAVAGGLPTTWTASPRPTVVTDGRSPFDLPRSRPANGEDYARFADNPFLTVRQVPAAAFAIDVDTASYSNVRRFITHSQLPPPDAVRIEELLNYFTYDYPRATGEHPIAANIEAAAAPWNPAHRLVRIGIKARDVEIGRKPGNIVLLVDVSGSMNSPDRLGLLQQGMRMLVSRLTESDTLSIVTYAGESGIALPPTNGAQQPAILNVIDGLRAEGSTNGGAGIQTAYDLAVANFIEGGVNRVILMTDGDFNLGVTRIEDLVSLIEQRARSGVFLSVLGVGQGNLRDGIMERLADKGHGYYAYLDTLNEARKVLVDQMAGTLVTVAKDVKVQVEFNPAEVTAYRLIGYENRLLTARDFDNDRRDGGDMGAGHTVTALFEVVPRGAEVDTAGTDPGRFQQAAERVSVVDRDSPPRQGILDLKIRYKNPEGSESKLFEFPFIDAGQGFNRASLDFRFAAAVAAFGMILRDSPYKGGSTLEDVVAIARESRGPDRTGYREEFVGLAERARQLWRPAPRR